MENYNKNLSSKLHILWRLGTFSVPFGNWAGIFSNSEKINDNIICTAFVVWFQTIIDFLKESPRLKNIIKETYPDLNYEGEVLLERINDLITKCENIAMLFSYEEQVFLRDRRLQNVHGFLSQYMREEVSFDYFNTETKKVEGKKISINNYTDIVRPFYQNDNMFVSEMKLRNRVVVSEEWVKLASIHQRFFKPENLIVIQELMSKEDSNKV